MQIIIKNSHVLQIISEYCGTHSIVTVRTDNQPMQFITKIYYIHYKLSCKSMVVQQSQNKKVVKIAKHTRLRFRVRLERTCKSMEIQHFSEVVMACLAFLFLFLISLFILQKNKLSKNTNILKKKKYSKYPRVSITSLNNNAYDRNKQQLRQKQITLFILQLKTPKVSNKSGFLSQTR